MQDGKHDIVRTRAQVNTLVDSGRGKIVNMSTSASLHAEYDSLSIAEKDELVRELEAYNAAKSNAPHHLIKAQSTDVALLGQDLRTRVCRITHTLARALTTPLS